MAAKKSKEPLPSDTIPWLDAPRDYKIGLHEGKIVCKNPKGNLLASLPPWLKDEEVTEQLQALVAWLEEHRMECMHTVERWMLRSLIIPADILPPLWNDLDWRNSLENMIIAPASKSGQIDLEKTGFLKQIDSKKGLGVIDVDGESQWLKPNQIAIPHPILIGELDGLRELASDLGIKQEIEQLYRPIHKPTTDQLPLKSIRDYEGGAFDQLNFALGVCRRLGYPVRGGYAVCRIWEGTNPLEARYYVGAEAPDSPTETGELIFLNAKQQATRIDEVGPVTFSEGVRMASAIYAKRKVEKQEEVQV